MCWWVCVSVVPGQVISLPRLIRSLTGEPSWHRGRVWSQRIMEWWRPPLILSTLSLSWHDIFGWLSSSQLANFVVYSPDYSCYFKAPLPRANRLDSEVGSRSNSQFPGWNSRIQAPLLFFFSWSCCTFSNFSRSSHLEYGSGWYNIDRRHCDCRKQWCWLRAIYWPPK